MPSVNWRASRHFDRCPPRFGPRRAPPPGQQCLNNNRGIPPPEDATVLIWWIWDRGGGMARHFDLGFFESEDGQRLHVACGPGAEHYSNLRAATAINMASPGEMNDLEYWILHNLPPEIQQQARDLISQFCQRRFGYAPW